jgi:hypothetical protein
MRGLEGMLDAMRQRGELGEQEQNSASRLGKAKRPNFATVDCWALRFAQPTENIHMR